MYKCIISCPLDQKPHLPFSSTHRYSTINELTADSLLAYNTTKQRQYFEVEVIDNQPDQPGTLDENLDKVDSFEKDNLLSVGIPDLAFTYLTLAEYSPIVPELMDAWIDKDNNQEFVIITIESEVKPLKDYVQDSGLETLELLEILQNIAKLWKSFSKIDCSKSLREVSNLNINREGVLILDKLYPDDKPLKLEELLASWSELTTATKDEYLSLIADIKTKVVSGEVTNISELRDELQIMSQEIQLQSILEEQDDEIDLDFNPEESEEYQTIAEQMEDYDDHYEEAEATQINQDIDDQPTVVLPMKLLSIKEVGLTDIGRRRGHNEDCFAIETEVHKQETSQGTNLSAKGLFIVCDGMGGHASGEIASSMAVKHLRNYFYQNWQQQFPEPETIKEGVLLANEVLYSLNMEKGQTGSGRMGTTLVMGILENNKVSVAHVGDSRAYKLTRKGGLELLTTDHCVAQTEIKQGVDPAIAYGRPDAYQLTQALGPRDNTFVQPEVTSINIKEDTLLIFCSDGLYDNDLLEKNYQQFLLPLISSSSNLEEGVGKLIDLGNQVNGHDNLTCIMVRIKVQPNLENQAALF